MWYFEVSSLNPFQISNDFILFRFTIYLSITNLCTWSRIQIHSIQIHIVLFTLQFLFVDHLHNEGSTRRLYIHVLPFPETDKLYGRPRQFHQNISCRMLWVLTFKLSEKIKQIFEN